MKTSQLSRLAVPHIRLTRHAAAFTDHQLEIHSEPESIDAHINVQSVNVVLIELCYVRRTRALRHLAIVYVPLSVWLSSLHGPLNVRLY